ncbi:FHA domain-containing protein [Haliangium sp.]|uniref:FHA domain-containing protein n=1 Tax=Haliangium sp. TaxID=2663208 RepID=UPI003D0F5C1B
MNWLQKPKSEERRTKTLKDDLGGVPSTDPVRSLRPLPDGTLFPLHDGRRVHSVGAAEYVDLVLDDDWVSGVQFLVWTVESRCQLEDSDSKNGTLINGVAVQGRAALLAGDVITAGRTNLLACGAAGAEQQIRLSGLDLDECLRRGAELYGSQQRAGDALRIGQSTLSKWLRGKRFRSAT